MSRYRSEIIVSFLLIIMTLAPYWQARNHEFINYDDDDYVTNNERVKAGWTWESLSWAFTTRVHKHWHPLTWVSHMTDCQFFGLNPAGHHLTSVFLHLLNTLLLFLILRRMTGALWRSAVVAALFAIHPLHVESVTWVADRKDLLSATFMVLAIWAYAYYSERPGFGRYLLILTAFVLGLMAKPMVVTLPFVLLLMDYWPLDRLQPGKGPSPQRHESLKFRYQKSPVRRLVWEKLLIFVIMAAFAMTAIVARQQQGKLMLALIELWPKVSDIPNAFLNYAIYIGKMLWPLNLATPYPQRHMPPVWQLVGAALLLICISFLVFWKGRRHRYLLVGWLWYLVTLLPVAGVIRRAPHNVADRYTYLPLVGLFIMIAWGVPHLVAGWRSRRLVLGILTGTLFLCLTVLTWLQVRYWKDSVTLFEHVVSITADNVLAHNNLAVALEMQGRFDEAVSHYSEALRLDPKIAKLRNNLGAVLIKQHRFEEAVFHFSEALRIEPDYAEAHYNLGIATGEQGKAQEAVGHFSEALRIDPEYAAAHHRLGLILEEEGHFEEAIGHYSEAVRIRPNHAETHFDLGDALAKQGRIKEAEYHFSEAVRLSPDYAEAHNNLGVIREAQGRFEEAVGHYSQSLRIKPDHAGVHFNMGNALAAQGRLKEAIGHYSEAVRIDPDHAGAHNKLGIALAKQGRLNEAIGYFSEAVRIDPDHAGAHNNLGAALAKQGRLDEAVSHYREALRIRPDSAEIHNNLGDALAKQGRVEEATTHFSKALKIKRDSRNAP